MVDRVAFLIGNQTFHPNSDLPPLLGPINDVEALCRVLRDPERGQFEVHEFLGKASYEILPELAHALNAATPGDLFLIYYSGHGTLDRSGRLCLATSETQKSALLATSIRALHLRELVEESDCDQVVLLLDCCYSGAVEGLRGGVGDELHAIEDAHGFYIITATTALEAAREAQAGPGGVVMGRFTAALVDGIESGAADRGQKGKIFLSDLRRHLGEAVRGQRPQFFDRRASGDPLISLSPMAALLDPIVLADLNANQLYRRRGAASALADVVRNGDPAAREAARNALVTRLPHEPDSTVRGELEAALTAVDVNVGNLPQPPTAPPMCIAPITEGPGRHRKKV